MSSRCRLARLDSVLVVGVEVVVDDSGEAAFEAAQCLGFGGTGVKPFVVVGPAEPIEADPGHGDAVQCGVELTVARAAHPDPAAVLPDHTGMGATFPLEANPPGWHEF
jgi:hypothetical protein